MSIKNNNSVKKSDPKTKRSGFIAFQNRMLPIDGITDARIDKQSGWCLRVDVKGIHDIVFFTPNEDTKESAKELLNEFAEKLNKAINN